jgi:ABC-type nitrate/sulfonate/bicarbonate transport system substrate-binding protein
MGLLGASSHAVRLALLRSRHVLLMYFALLFIVPLFGSPVSAIGQVSPQLKWKHQFQFAGYYAAIEKGFYRIGCLEDETREGPDVDAGAWVATTGADFGICTTSILVNPLEHANNVVFGVIFQHSASGILVPHRAGVRAARG